MNRATPRGSESEEESKVFAPKETQPKKKRLRKYTHGHSFNIKKNFPKDSLICRFNSENVQMKARPLKLKVGYIV